ncbi:DUF3499 family protein [Hoyosella subflava]|uniref:DUF3499 family protein n=1 Tax=Hoyosella subflava TaxID=639313 RepID=UPI000A2F3007|nr:DUF3499 family protein [Hoyosella subflava]
MSIVRRCCKPGCRGPAVATLTYVYAESLAVVEPLTDSDGPHSWDLCEAHALRITAPRNWELIRHWSPVDALPAESVPGTGDCTVPGEVDLDSPGDEPFYRETQSRRSHLRALPAPGIESPVF